MFPPCRTSLDSSTANEFTMDPAATNDGNGDTSFSASSSCSSQTSKEDTSSMAAAAVLRDGSIHEYGGRGNDGTATPDQSDVASNEPPPSTGKGPTEAANKDSPAGSPSHPGPPRRPMWKIALLALLLAILLFGAGVGVGLVIQQSRTDSQSMSVSSVTNDNSENMDVSSAPSTQAPGDTAGPGSSTENPKPAVEAARTGSPSGTPSTESPTAFPSDSPSMTPSQAQSDSPTVNRTADPSGASSLAPSAALPATAAPDKDDASQLVAATYIPGNLTRLQENLLLSEGLLVRLVAESGKPVAYFPDGGNANGRALIPVESTDPFHILPDGAATFPDTREWNLGGWIYVSNSESKEKNEGGVGAITFDRDGRVIDYRMVLTNTTMNCSGGRTPWNTWASCEEVEFDGLIYQVDPLGERPPEVMTLGSDGGRWEAFSYDVRNLDVPRFFATEDHNKGTVRRFTPDTTLWGTGNEWDMLHGEGVTDYLVVSPFANLTGGTFDWVDDLEAARNNARSHYPQSEGIDVHEGIMYVTCKGIKMLFIFDLDSMTYKNMTTVSGLFDGHPDQMQRIVGNDGGLLYFTEEGGPDAGIHARDENGRFFTILESALYEDETTGLSFSPDGKHMYVAYQVNGLLFDVWREDSLPFNAKSLDVKYHKVGTRRHRLSSQWIGF